MSAKLLIAARSRLNSRVLSLSRFLTFALASKTHTASQATNAVSPADCLASD